MGLHVCVFVCVLGMMQIVLPKQRLHSSSLSLSIVESLYSTSQKPVVHV